MEELENRPSGSGQKGRSKARWGWGLAGGLLVLSKLKTLLFGALAFLKFGKCLSTGLSMLLMVATYAWLYGWRYAVGIVLLLFIHEMGHVAFARWRGLEVSAPMFIPFVGAFISLKEQPQDAQTEACVAVGGPLFGLAGALACIGLAVLFQSQLLLAVAYFGCFITVFNLIPVHPLDGGRIVTALSPLLWGLGIVMMGGVVFLFFNPIALLILLLCIGKAYSTWKHRHELAEYYRVPAAFRWKMGITYFTLFGLASFFSVLLHELLRNN